MVIKIILLMCLSWWVGKHISLRKECNNVCYPLGIQIQHWVFSWHIFIQCYRFKFEIYVNDWTLLDYRKTKTIDLLPCWRKGVGGMYGTPHGDFEFPFNQFCWLTKVISKEHNHGN